MTCRFAFGNISRTPYSLLHNERFLKCRLTVFVNCWRHRWILGGFVHALGSWCERYRSGTGARQSDRSGLWIKPAPRSDYISYAPLPARSTLRSAHMLWATYKKKDTFLICHIKYSEVWTVVYFVYRKSRSATKSKNFSSPHTAEMFSCVSYFN